MVEITNFKAVLETTYENKLFSYTLFIRQQKNSNKYSCGMYIITSNYDSINYKKMILTRKNKEIIFIEDATYAQANKWLTGCRNLIREHNHSIEKKFTKKGY